MQAGMDRFVDKGLQLQAGNGMVGGDPLMRQNPASANAMAEQRLKLPLQRDSMDDSAMKQRFGENMIQLLDANHEFILKFAAASGQPSGQALHVAAGGMTSQVPTRNQQLPGSSPDIKPDINAMLNPRAAGSEGSLIGIPGSNQSSNNLTLKGWPLTVTENKSTSSWHHHLPVRAMSGSEDDSIHTNEPASTDASLAAQLAALLSHLSHSTNNTQNSFPTISMSIKLNENNYSMWSRLIHIKVGGQGKLHHLTGVPAPPGAEEPEFPQWEQDDLIVCSWLLDNMEPELVNQYAEFPTAKDLWKGLYATFNKGKDGIQLFNLFVRANSIKQGTESLESIYSNLQRLWRDIELMDPNPMKSPEGIRIWNTKRAENKLYQFLNAVSEEFDQEKRDILRQNPLPEVESAYVTIQSERDRRTIMGTGRREVETSSTGIGAGFKVTPRPEVREVTSRPINASKPHQATRRGKLTRGGGGVDRKSMRCSHCGKFRHSKEECFQIIGFPEGWRSQRRESHDADNLVSEYGIC